MFDKFLKGLTSTFTPKALGAAAGFVLILVALHYFRADPETLAMKIPRMDEAA